MDILRDLKRRIETNDAEIKCAERELDLLDFDDFKGKNEMRAIISKMTNDSIKMLSTYHSIRMDDTLFAEKLKSEIKLLEAKVQMLASKDNGYIAAEKIVNYIDMLAENLIDEEGKLRKPGGEQDD